ncbi:MAG: MFS transporter [Chloroflexi bacterium]|nr:MFS transporter [Chloroflexota bacterium]
MSISAESFRRVAVPSLLTLGLMLAQWMVIAFIPLYLVDIGLSQFQVSALLTSFPITALLLVLPSGVLSDRFSPRKLVILSTGLFALFPAGLWLLARYDAGFWALWGPFLAGGAGSALFFAASGAYFYKFLGDSRKGAKLGVFTAVGIFGYALGPAIGGALLSARDMPFLLGAAFWLCLSLLGASFLLLETEPEKTAAIGYRQDLASKEMLVLVGLTFLVSLHLGVEQTSLSLFLNRNIGLSESSVGRMFLFIGLAMAAFTLANGFFSDRFNGKGVNMGSLFYIGVALSGAFNVVMLFPKAFDSVLAVRVLHVLGESSYVMAQRMIISALFPAARVGGNLGVVNATVRAGVLAGMLLSGMMPGYVLPFVVTGAAAVIGVPLGMALRPKFR